MTSIHSRARVYNETHSLFWAEGFAFSYAPLLHYLHRYLQGMLVIISNSMLLFCYYNCLFYL